MRKKLERLSSALGKMLQARGMSGRLSEYRILGAWERTVGAVIASHARPVSVRGTKLFLLVDSPAWMQQLSLMKPDIIEKVNRGLGKKDAVKEIALNLGEVSLAQRFSPRPSVPYTLTAEEQDKIEGFVAGLQDPDVRDALKRVIEKDFLRKKEKRA